MYEYKILSRDALYVHELEKDTNKLASEGFEIDKFSCSEYKAIIVMKRVKQ